MVKYAQNELFSITDFSKQLASVIKNIKEQSIEKIGVLKNNKLEAVVISTDEYERLKSYEDIIENLEHQDIYKTIENRKTTPTSQYVSLEQMTKEFGIDLDTI